MPPPHARAAIDGLVAIDPDFGRVLALAGPLPWRSRSAGFPGLLQAIVGQMISNQAAAAIWGRVRAVPDALHPAGLMTLPDETLRGMGFSRPKVVHARALAEAFLSGALETDRLAAMGDDDAIAAIAAVKGMGPWSAEIYLLFALDRLDVFPAGDIALAASAMELKKLPDRPGPKALRGLALQWQPYRSIAARLLWHYWRYHTGRPSMDDFGIAPV